MTECTCCEPNISIEEYKLQAIPRLAAIDLLAKKIDFSISSWMWTPEGERYERLMREQCQAERDAGL